MQLKYINFLKLPNGTKLKFILGLLFLSKSYNLQAIDENNLFSAKLPLKAQYLEI